VHIEYSQVSRFWNIPVVRAAAHCYTPG